MIQRVGTVVRFDLGVSGVRDLGSKGSESSSGVRDLGPKESRV